MDAKTLSAEVREHRGKGPARQLRNRGLIPAVFYGPETETVAISCSPVELERLITGKYARNQLIELDRVRDARQKLDALGDAPSSDYARLRHWTSELYVAFAEGRHHLDEDALHERARVGLSATPAVPLLALCGWAFSRLGDEDFAEHLLRTALERWESPVRNKFPRLDRWVSTLDLPSET